MKLLDIGAVARQSGVAPSTLRYYEEKGLIRSVARNGLRRQFDQPVLTQLALISMGKMAGFSLDDMRRIFDKDGTPQLPRSELHSRADGLDQQIRGLIRLRDALRHVADCPKENHLDCPKFRRLMRFANRVADTGASARRQE
ncbi:helix-turn-helix domain-containing protein [Paracoccus sp. Z330]|uniref:Helix-turn-helix domain-containing protein n=1 Tax=Paracoccus onchidii TaxID=3017813 RepID=A0ABT4ZHA9_9RHOB|nr:helix-turn-helix domain-containing protein [Paracoccus onchidii]MDB6178701.1 helix-turn-helix domain-containing protein [Paracoccus onchidii]